MNYWKRVRKVLRKSNVVIEVVDARFAEEMRNKELEESCVRADKKILLAINKCDLLEKHEALALSKKLSKESDTVLVSAKKRIGKYRIKKFLGTIAKKRKVIVGVIGYPNTGKSSLINYLAGRKSARTSIIAGFTRGEQLIRLTEEIMMVDTPGVLPFFKGGETKLALLAAKNPQALSDPTIAAKKILQQLGQKKIEQEFGVKQVGYDYDKLLEQIAIAKKRLKKGGVADVQTMAKKIILDWQKGKFSN